MSTSTASEPALDVKTTRCRVLSVADSRAGGDFVAWGHLTTLEVLDGEYAGQVRTIDSVLTPMVADEYFAFARAQAAIDRKEERARMNRVSLTPDDHEPWPPLEIEYEITVRRLTPAPGA